MDMSFYSRMCVWYSVRNIMLSRETFVRLSTGIMMGFVLGVVLHESSKIDAGVLNRSTLFADPPGTSSNMPMGWGYSNCQSYCTTFAAGAYPDSGACETARQQACFGTSSSFSMGICELGTCYNCPGGPDGCANCTCQNGGNASACATQCNPSSPSSPSSSSSSCAVWTCSGAPSWTCTTPSSGTSSSTFSCASGTTACNGMFCCTSAQTCTFVGCGTVTSSTTSS